MEELSPSPFGTLLRRFRLDASLTQSELAERAGMSVDAISTLERGARRNPHRDTVRLLADALRLAPPDRRIFEEAALKAAIPTAAGRHTPALPPTGNFLGALPVGPLVAREEELDRIQAILDAAADGVGQLLVLGGELGAGKTRLAQEAMVEATNRGFVVGTGRCYQAEAETPYYPMLEAVAELEASAPAGLRVDLERRGQEIRRLVGAGTPAAPGLNGSLEDRQRLFGAVADCLAELARMLPGALFLDDLHWADGGTVRLLQHLAHATRGGRTLLLATLRDARLSEEHPVLRQVLQDLTRERLVERITVRRLSAEETAALVAASMGPTSEEFAEFIHRRTKGNPRFVDQMVRSLGGRLHLVREIGAGAMGRVFEAEDSQTGRTVAAKLMLARGGIDADALVRFQQEITVLAALTHPNIVEIYDTFVEEHASCIIMELLEGPSLGQMLRAGPLPLSRAKTILLQVAAALDYAHAQLIVHRDIKPDNVMVLEGHPEGTRVKVTDFGIARILQPDTSLQTMATTGMRMGTPLYMAPEQIEGKKIDGRTDIYALGAMLFHMVTGRPPFDGSDTLAVAVKHLQEEPAPPSDSDPAIPADWDALILRALAKDPANRYGSAKEMEGAIATLSENAVPSETAPASRDPTVDPKVTTGRRRRAGWLGAAATLSALVLAGGLFLHRPGAGRSQGSVAARLIASWEIPVDPVLAPSGVAVDRRGVVYVADSGGDRIVTFSPSGRVLGSWGTTGSGPGQLRNPRGLALDGRGNVYVADTGNDRIEKFSSSGRFIASWGKRGTRPGQFRSPQGVVVGTAGTIYVADTGNGRVQALTPAGTPIRYWDPNGTEHGPLVGPTSLAAYGDLNARVWVADPADGQGHVLEADGSFAFHWPPGLVTPSAVVIDHPSGNAYFLDTGLQEIRKFDNHGHLVRRWHGPFHSARGLAVDAHGTMYVADTGNHRILKLGPTGRVLGSWSEISKAAQPTASPQALARDARGNVYVAESSGSQIVELSPAGHVLERWKGGGSAGPLGLPSAVAVDAHGHVCVADMPNDRIVRFSPSGRVEAAWGTSGSAPGQFFQPRGVSVDRRGNVYVVDSLNIRIEKFSATGATRDVWVPQEYPLRPGVYRFVPSFYGMAIDSRGFAYVTDTLNDLIVKLSPRGETVARWSGAGSQPGQLRAPEGVAVSASGTIYVADTGNHRVELFAPSGKVIGTIREGLDAPADVLVAEDRRGASTLYVADSGSGRVLQFSVAS